LPYGAKCPTMLAMNAKQLRKLLETHGLAQTEAARLLDLDPRTMRRYVAGELPVSRVIEYALRWALAQRGESKS
jgi:hypothetical protein